MGTAKNIRIARQAKGLSVDAVAASLSINVNWVYDLESYDDEAGSTLSLEGLFNLCDLIGTSPGTLYADSEVDTAGRVVWTPEFADLLRTRLADCKAVGRDLEDECGWHADDLLSPDIILIVCLDQVVDTVKAMGGVNWLGSVDSWYELWRTERRGQYPCRSPDGPQGRP